MYQCSLAIIVNQKLEMGCECPVNKATVSRVIPGGGGRVAGSGVGQGTDGHSTTRGQVTTGGHVSGGGVGGHSSTGGQVTTGGHVSGGGGDGQMHSGVGLLVTIGQGVHIGLVGGVEVATVVDGVEVATVEMGTEENRETHYNNRMPPPPPSMVRIVHDTQCTTV